MSANPIEPDRALARAAIADLEAFRQAVLREVAERLVTSGGEPFGLGETAVAGVLLDGDLPARGPDGDLAALRYSALSADRHADWVVSPAGLDGAACALESLRWQARQLAAAGPATVAASSVVAAARAELLGSLARTLDTSSVLEALWSLVRSSLPPGDRRALLAELDDLLGLGVCGERSWAADELPAAARSLIAERDAARRARDWARSDELREQLAALGVEAQDSREGSLYRRRE